jgi:hypothetical protein
MRAGQLEALLQHIAAENRTNLGSHSPTFNPRT